MLQHAIISIDLNLNHHELYERIWQPQAFLHWASGMCGAGLKQDGNAWTGEGMEGPLRVRFTEHNQFGIMDHFVSQAGEPEIYVPLRVVANQEGSTVTITLFRQRSTTETMFATEVEWARRDLEALKLWVERAGSRSSSIPSGS